MQRREVGPHAVGNRPSLVGEVVGSRGEVARVPHDDGVDRQARFGYRRSRSLSEDLTGNSTRHFPRVDCAGIRPWCGCREWWTTSREVARVARCYFLPTMQRATPGTRTLPSLSYELTFAMAVARIRSRAGSSTC